MMKTLRYLVLPLLTLCAASCNYLDISPDMGLDEKEVFTKYANFVSVLDGIYNQSGNKKDANGKSLNIKYASFPLRFDANDFRFTFACMTDLADAGRQGLRVELIKAGTLGENCKFLVDYRCPIFMGGWYCIGVANSVIEHIDWLEDAPELEKQDMLAQAYFLRAWFHMTICNFFGGQPYIDHFLQAGESWDLPRLSATETYQKCAEDFKRAYDIFSAVGLERRDGKPGEEGHLNNAKQDRPNGVAAMALRGRCLLFAASPLHNTSGDRKLWEDAAVANAEALDLALKNGYALMDWDHWDNNFFRVAYCNEQLWAWNARSSKSSGEYLRNYLGYPINDDATGGGQNPTQNAVDLYETKWGDPLFTQEERDAAYGITEADEGSIGPDGKLHHYYEQNPYVNRDPRFYKNIIFDGATAIGVKDVINIYYDNEAGMYPTTELSGKIRSFGVEWNSANRSNTTTGYYTAKRWDGRFVDVTNYVTDPLIRLAEVYLNYAEAANMAYDNPRGAVPGHISALEAVNTIRHRAQMPDVQERFTKDSKSFNERVINERTVELMYEGYHYFVDERRWMIAPERMRAPLMGMFVETCPKDAAHPNGKLYTRKPIVHQATWKDAMYYWYLYKDEAAKYKNYVNNEAW